MRLLSPGLTPLLLAPLLLSACASYTDQTQAIRSAWVVGDNQEAARLASRAAQDKANSVDEMVFVLESGSAWRAAGEPEESTRTFERAEQLFAERDQGAEVRLGAAALANFTNPTFLPYPGYAYDRIMLHTYSALNAMQMGELERARVALNRTLEAQREAVRMNAERIAEAKALARESATASASGGEVYNAQRAESDPRFQRQIQEAYRHLSDLPSYADYVNPFAVYLDALFFMAQSTGFSDLERARLSLQRVIAFHPDNPYFRQDLAQIERLLGGGTPERVTYVIFETGMAPVREEIRIDIPLFVVSQAVPYVGVAFPTLRFNSQYVPRLTVRADGKDYPTHLVASMDAIVATEFENDLPSVITRTLISAGTKALAQYGLYQATRDSGSLGALVMIAGTIYQASMNQADLRSWMTLPKQFQVARLPTPEDNRLTLIPQGFPGSLTVNLEPAQIQVVYVKSNSNRAPLHTNTFILLPEADSGPLIQ